MQDFAYQCCLSCTSLHLLVDESFPLQSCQTPYPASLYAKQRQERQLNKYFFGRSFLASKVDCLCPNLKYGDVSITQSSLKNIGLVFCMQFPPYISPQLEECTHHRENCNTHSLMIVWFCLPGFDFHFYCLVFTEALCHAWDIKSFEYFTKILHLFLSSRPLFLNSLRTIKILSMLLTLHENFWFVFAVLFYFTMYATEITLFFLHYYHCQCSFSNTLLTDLSKKMQNENI